MVTSIASAVKEFFDRLPMDAEFGCWDLKRAVARLYPQSEYTHGDTILRRLRENRYGKGYEIVCVNPNKSRYRKVKFAIKAKPKNPKSGKAK